MWENSFAALKPSVGKGFKNGILERYFFEGILTKFATADVDLRRCI